MYKRQAKPGISVSTKAVYESLDAMTLAASDHPDIDGLIEAIRSQNLLEVAGRFGNCLLYTSLHGSAYLFKHIEVQPAYFSIALKKGYEFRWEDDSP